MNRTGRLFAMTVLLQGRARVQAGDLALTAGRATPPVRDPSRW